MAEIITQDDCIGGRPTEDEGSEPIAEDAGDSEVSEGEAATVKEGLQYCNGYFAFYPASDFTQDEDYCDTFLKLKGLFKDDLYV